MTLDVHDILTGSRPDGTAFPGTGDLTCANWTSSGKGRAEVGHHDAMGQGDPRERSWNSAHANQNCANTAPRGGAGRIYCFATK